MKFVHFRQASEYVLRNQEIAGIKLSPQLTALVESVKEDGFDYPSDILSGSWCDKTPHSWSIVKCHYIEYPFASRRAASYLPARACRSLDHGWQKIRFCLRLAEAGSKIERAL
jgi:hypothetical protein